LARIDDLDGPDYPAPAKLNLFLHVIGRRPDGYHELQTVFRFIDHADRLRFGARPDGLIRRIAGNEGVPEDADLTVRAARLLQQTTGTTRGADLAIEKHLPMGGGLGGGSSDAATALIVLNHLWGTGLRRSELQRLARTLGADVPVFVYGASAFAEGVGEQLQSVELPPAWYVVVAPPAHVSTAMVFAQPDLTRHSDRITLAAFFSGTNPDGSSTVGAGKAVVLRNDLEAVVTRLVPEVRQARDWLNRYGAARMTGSGSCVFCAYPTEQEARAVWARRPEGMQGFVAAGIDRHPLSDLTNS
jgi:4-diphosphocytidyl-2-C-methyl-D-erythritol kinase